jgi:hypothetical protein
MPAKGDSFGRQAGQKAADLPPQGAVRVSRQPDHLRSRPPGEPGPHRYDAPNGEYLVRYVGQDLETCLVEVLSDFRKKPEVNGVLAGISGVDDGYLPVSTVGLGHEQAIQGDPPAPISMALAEKLVTLQIGVVVLTEPGTFADVSNPFVRRELDRHRLVRGAVEEFDKQVGTPPDRSSHLDGGLIRLAGPIGREITQAVSLAVYEETTHYNEKKFAGIAYHSRWYDEKRCWAIFGEVPVKVEPIRSLNPNNAEDWAAVRLAAQLHGLTLPDSWR